MSAGPAVRQSVLPIPSRRFIAAAALAAPLFLVAPALAVLVDIALLALLVIDWHRTPRLRVTRTVPRQIGLGESARAHVVLIAPRATLVHLTDDLPATVVRSGEHRLVAALAADEPFELSYELTALERGVHRVGDLHLRVRGTMGLAWRQTRIAQAEEIRAVPGLAEMRRHRLLGLNERMRRAGLRRTRQRGEGHSFASLREYARGDDPRSIDWKASARRGGLIVREFEAERSQSVMIVLDAGRLMMERIGNRERLDHAMAAALLLADVAGLHGDRVGLFAFADEVLQFMPPRRLAIDRLAVAMSDVQARLVEPNYPIAFSTLRRRLGRRSLIVVFTDVIDSVASQTLIAHLGFSAERHLVVAVSLRNPALEDWAEAPVADEDDAFRRAASEEMLAARALALATMRRTGVQVIDATPERAVTDVLNRYLEIKYRGEL